MRITQRSRHIRVVRLVLLVGSIGAYASVAACSDGAPLGGPHGDHTASVVAPNDVNSSSSSVAGASSTASIDAGSSSSSSPEAGGGVSEGGGPTGAGPTWTAIFNAYMTDCKSCHTQCTSAKNTFLWLRSQGYITGSSPALVSSSQSCLSWYGGNMPPGAGDNAAAVADMNAWAAGGALDN